MRQVHINDLMAWKDSTIFVATEYKGATAVKVVLVQDAHNKLYADCIVTDKDGRYFFGKEMDLK